MKILLLTNKENSPKLDSENLEIIELNEYCEESIYNIYLNNGKLSFICDDIDFLIKIYRIYNNFFDAFIYSSVNEKKVTTIFAKNIDKNLNKPIYFFNKQANIKELDFIKINSLKEIKNQKENIHFEKVFFFENKYFFTQNNNFNFKIIKLDNSQEPKDIDIKTHFHNVENQILNYIELLLDIFTNTHNDDFDIKIETIKTALEQESIFIQKRFITIFKFVINNLENQILKLYLGSVLNSFKYTNSEHFNTTIDEIDKSEYINTFNKYYYFWQYFRVYFLKPSIQNTNAQYKLWNLYNNVYKDFEPLVEDIRPLKKEERNKDLIFIFIGQFLTMEHAPTKLVIQRAYHLIKNFNKEILIINTGELLTQVGELPFFKKMPPKKLKDFVNSNKILYNDIEIPFYQSSFEMPNVDEINNIISIVQEYKPYFLLNIGSANLTCDLCSKIIPSVSFPTTSELAITKSQIKINRTVLSKEDEIFMNYTNTKKDSIIVSNPKGEAISKVNYLKKDFALPENKFLLSVVGNRLYNEITETFISMLLETVKFNTFIVFIGKFYNYDKFCDTFPELKNNSTHIGYQKHLYDVLALFDLSINPDRMGGAHGAFYSIMHSIPVVTLNKGDVHTMTKGIFSVSNYNEMKKRILMYIQDSDFYKKQSKLAQETFIEGTDIKSELTDLISQIEKNPYFK